MIYAEMLDEIVTSATSSLGAASPEAFDRRMPTRAAPASLLLFIGTGFQPTADMCNMLARDGMRCLWLAGVGPALRAARLARFNVVVIDAAALGASGAVLLADLTAALRCPMIVVAHQADEVDEIVALELGADAYLTRPLAPRRLRAHLRACMRVHAPPDAGELQPRSPVEAPTRVAGWQLDRIANQLLRDGACVAVTDVQSALLQCLFESHGRIVPRTQLAAALPARRDVSARSVDVYIHRLRARLREAGIDDLVIQAIRGRGYVLGG